MGVNPVLTVVKQKDAFIGQHSRRTAFGQRTIEIAIPRIDHAFQFSVFIQFRSPVDQVIRRGNIDHPFTPIHQIFTVYARDDEFIAVEFGYDRSRFALQIEETP